MRVRSFLVPETFSHIKQYNFVKTQVKPSLKFVHYNGEVLTHGSSSSTLLNFGIKSISKLCSGVSHGVISMSFVTQASCIT